jgi:CHAD domain-containing protein
VASLNPSLPNLDASNTVHFKTILRKTWEKLKKNFKKAQKACLEKESHDLRVSLRRFIEILKIAELAFPKISVKNARKKARKLLKALGPLRDTQILLLQTKEWNQEGLLNFLLKRLEKQELRERTAIQKKLRKTKLKELGIVVEEIEKKQAATLLELKTLVIERLQKTFQRVVKKLHGLDERDPASIHKLRVAFKKFRYTSELLEHFHLGISKEKLKLMHDLQQEMGRIQDLHIFVEFLKTAKGENQEEKKALKQTQKKADEMLNGLCVAFVSSAARKIKEVQVKEV